MLDLTGKKNYLDMNKHVNSVIGMKTIERIDRIRDAIDRLGFQMGHPNHALMTDVDAVALQPKNNCLPIYARDAVLFTGSLHDLEQWLKGLDWARQYDSYLGAMSDKRRDQYEAKEVVRLEKIKYNKARAETFETLKKEHK